MFQIGGYEPSTVIDFDIPKKYGLRQTIADTLGIGGIMRALRTIPVLLDIAHDMEEVCPDALFINYVNPMAMLIDGYRSVLLLGQMPDWGQLFWVLLFSCILIVSAVRVFNRNDRIYPKLV